MEFCAIKTLHALRPTMSWINLKAAVECDCIDAFFLPFQHTSNIATQTAATEVMYTLLSRQHGHLALLRQALKPNRIALIRQAFSHVTTDNEERYTLLKKLSELLSVLADAMAQHHELMDVDKMDTPAFFRESFMIVMAQSRWCFAVSLGRKPSPGGVM